MAGQSVSILSSVSSSASSLSGAVARRRVAALAWPRVVLCDLDGTLIDTMPVLADIATEVMAEVYGTPKVLARELYISTCGLPFIKQLGAIFPGDARNEGASDVFESRKPALTSRARMAAETAVALARLRDAGTKVVVSSNNGQENVDTFAGGSVFKFDLALGFGDGLAKGRPHIDRVVKEWGVGRQEILFVGDSLHDGQIAEDEGIPFVGVAGTFSRERFQLRFPNVPVVSRFAELPSLF